MPAPMAPRPITPTRCAVTLLSFIMSPIEITTVPGTLRIEGAAWAGNVIMLSYNLWQKNTGKPLYLRRSADPYGLAKRPADRDSERSVL